MRRSLNLSKRGLNKITAFKLIHLKFLLASLLDVANILLFYPTPAKDEDQVKKHKILLIRESIRDIRTKREILEKLNFEYLRIFLFSSFYI